MAVLATLWQAGYGAYLVGGGVRDALLGLEVGEWDVATDARPERIMRVFTGASYQNRFGTVLARGHEITTFRRDHRYADHRRPDSVTFSQDIYEDLARRDLTINAIAWGRRGLDASARLVDPADGQGDLRARLVRAVGDPGRRFDEDALRLLRAVRIAARLDFRIEPVTKQAMLAHAGDIEWVSEERIGAELRSMLGAEVPSRAIRLMGETGILATTLPELDALGVADLARTEATLDALAAAADGGSERLALAALFAEVDRESAAAALARLRISSRESEAIGTLMAAAAEPYRAGWSDADVRRYMSRVPPELLDDTLSLRAARAEARADGTATSEAELRERVTVQRTASAPLTVTDLVIDGDDLRETLGIPEGPIIGAILERLLADVIEDPSLDSRTTLLTRASLILDELVQGDRGQA
jgi:tRNA nucleotidyltransferase/poly(A) polymerase